MKWGKEKFDAVELNTEEPPMVFKAQLFALTGVQPDRQKVMVKGGTLKVQTHTTVRSLVKKILWCQICFVRVLDQCYILLWFTTKSKMRL